MLKLSLCFLFISLSILQGQAQNKLDFSQLKKWKVTGYGAKIKKSIFKVNTIGIDTNWRAIGFHKIETGLTEYDSYSIKCDFSPCPSLEIGFAFFRIDEKTKKNDLYFFNSYPAFQNSKVYTEFNSNGVFTSIGNENVIVLYIRNSNSNSINPTETFQLKTLEFVKIPKDYTDTNLIENGDFENFHALFRGAFCLQLTGLFPNWNCNTVSPQRAENQISIFLEDHPFEAYMQLTEFSTSVLGSPDIYYSTGKDTAASGYFYAGMNILADRYGDLNRGCEYLQIKLNRKLVENEKIRISFYYKIDKKHTSSNGLGIALTDSIIQKDFFTVAPSAIIFDEGLVYDDIQGSHEWNEIEFIYTAKGNEEFLTIGDFQKSDLKLGDSKKRFLSYYFIDDIKVESIKEE